jgi:hypothetical protein
VGACSPNDASLTEQQAIDIAWEALEPNTSSHDRAAWEVTGADRVTGREVRDLFDDEPVPGRCAPGPTPVSNQRIARDGRYWYVRLEPRPATPAPQPTEYYSPTAPANVPEPFVYEAHFLIDAGTGQVVARRLHCVII